ncbi:MAG: ROK family transcriptional regulator [Anaerolineales bacterium]
MQQYRTGDHALVREMNLSSVLGYLHRESPLSRAQLASLTNLNKSTISSLVEELIARGLIHEIGLESSGTGRPATLLQFNPQAGYIIGIEFGVGFITGILTNFTGEIIWRDSQETDSTAQTNQIIDQALKLVDYAIDKECPQDNRLLGVGISLPGLVDVENGVLTYSPNLQWQDVAFRQIFMTHTGLAIFIDNDANASAIGEHLFGAAKKSQDFIFIVAGVGIGGGLFLNGDVYRGSGGYAGEIGHTRIISEQNRPCRCGHQGCWENTGNQYSLIERVRARLEVGRQSLIHQLMSEQNSPVDLYIIKQAADSDDEEVREALNETGYVIGLGVANLINIFNPELVVIGGSMSIAGKYLLPAIEKAISDNAMEEPRRQTKVVLSKFGPDAISMGAIALVVKHVLANPTCVDRITTPP